MTGIREGGKAGEAETAEEGGGGTGEEVDNEAPLEFVDVAA